MHPNGEEEENSHPAKKNRVTMDFSLLTIPVLPEKIMHAAFPLQLQEVFFFFLVLGIFKLLSEVCDQQFCHFFATVESEGKYVQSNHIKYQ